MKKTLLIDDMRELPASRIAKTYADGLKALKEEGPWDLLLLDHNAEDHAFAHEMSFPVRRTVSPLSISSARLV